MALLRLPPLRFPIGHVLLTAGIHRRVQQGQFDPLPYLHRHVQGDWGDLSDNDRRQNDAALKSGEDRLFSSYSVAPDFALWIITEADRRVTTLLMPSEY